MSIADDLWDKGYLPHTWTEEEQNRVMALRKYIKKLETKNKQLRMALHASHYVTICPLCHSMPHYDNCKALEVSDE